MTVTVSSGQTYTVSSGQTDIGDIVLAGGTLDVLSGTIGSMPNVTTLIGARSRPRRTVSRRSIMMQSPKRAKAVPSRSNAVFHASPSKSVASDSEALVSSAGSSTK